MYQDAYVTSFATLRSHPDLHQLLSGQLICVRSLPAGKLEKSQIRHTVPSTKTRLLTRCLGMGSPTLMAP